MHIYYGSKYLGLKLHNMSNEPLGSKAHVGGRGRLTYSD